MLKQAFCAVAMISTSAFIASAQSNQDIDLHSEWGKSGGWVIKIDPSVGNGCYIESTLEDGTLVRVGFVPDREGGFFAAYHAEWIDIEDGVAGTIQFDFVKSLFEGEYVGVIKGDLHGGYAFFNNPEFIKEFGKRDEVSIKGDGENALAFKLNGTAKAINAARTCDAEQSSAQ